MEQGELVQWARQEAGRLRVGAGKGQPYRSPTAAVDFLRRHASGSSFLEQATRFALAEGPVLTTSSHHVVASVARVLEAWAEFIESGLGDALPIEARIRVEAATDLLDQVQQLLDDRSMHPAAAVVVTGAALEEFLRSMYIGCIEVLPGKPGLSTYASALRKCGKISATDMKNITAWAGLRNDAAHGHFDDVSRERALLMFEGVNLFLQQHRSG